MGQDFSPRKRLHQISNFAAIKKQLSIENNLLQFKRSEILKSCKIPSRIDIKGYIPRYSDQSTFLITIDYIPLCLHKLTIGKFQKLLKSTLAKSDYDISKAWTL